MLEQKDLQAIREIVEEVVDVKVNKIIDERVPEIVNGIIDEKVPGIVEKIVDKRITETENLILQYVDDTRRVLEDKIEKVQNNVDEIAQYYRIRRLEDETTEYLVKDVRGLTKRVDALEKRVDQLAAS